MRHRRYVRVMNLWYDTGPIPEINPSALGLLLAFGLPSPQYPIYIENVWVIQRNWKMPGMQKYRSLCPTFIALLTPCPGPIPDKSISEWTLFSMEGKQNGFMGRSKCRKTLSWIIHVSHVGDYEQWELTTIRECSRFWKCVSIGLGTRTYYVAA